MPRATSPRRGGAPDRAPAHRPASRDASESTGLRAGRRAPLFAAPGAPAGAGGRLVRAALWRAPQSAASDRIPRRGPAAGHGRERSVSADFLPDRRAARFRGRDSSPSLERTLDSRAAPLFGRRRHGRGGAAHGAHVPARTHLGTARAGLAHRSVAARHALCLRLDRAGDDLGRASRAGGDAGSAALGPVADFFRAHRPRLRTVTGRGPRVLLPQSVRPHRHSLGAGALSVGAHDARGAAGVSAAAAPVVGHRRRAAGFCGGLSRAPAATGRNLRVARRVPPGLVLRVLGSLFARGAAVAARALVGGRSGDSGVGAVVVAAPAGIAARAFVRGRALLHGMHAVFGRLSL